MLSPARLADAEKKKLVSIQRPFSTLRWVKNKFRYEPETLLRVISQIRAHRAETMLVEELRPEATADLAEENEDIYKRCRSRIQSQAYRLSFFATEVRTVDDLRNVPAEAVLGYAIIKCDDYGDETQSRVYESVICINQHRNSYVRGKQKWNFQVAGHPFSVEGYLYAQQNGVTNACAHVALRTAAASFHPNGDMSYREMNEILGIDHVRQWVGRKSKHSRVTMEKMVAVLESVGAQCDPGDYERHPKVTLKAYYEKMSKLPAWQEFAYGSIESGWPAIIIFGTTNGFGHAIPAFGHTFNQDMWVPNAEQIYFNSRQTPLKAKGRRRYLPSDAWLSSFICHDDNMGSNLCIPRHYLRIPTPQALTKALPNLGADFIAGVIGTRPPPIRYAAFRAELVAYNLLPRILARSPASKHNVWMQRLRAAIKTRRIIFRTIICRGEEYIGHLQKLRDWKDNHVEAEEIAKLTEELHSDSYWMVEVSIPDLFSMNFRKLGEILFRTDGAVSSESNFEMFELARVPGSFARATKHEIAEGKFDYTPSGIVDHAALYHCEKHDAINGRKRSTEP